MAVTKVGVSRNMRATIAYMTSGEMHHEHEGVDQRVLALGGHMLNPKDAYFDMKELQRAYGKDTEEYLAMRHEIISFDDKQFDPKDPTSVDRALEAVLIMGKRKYPENQFVVSIQADGKGNKIHGHLGVNNTKMNGHALRGEETSWYYAAKINDEVLQELGYETLSADKRQRGYEREDKQLAGDYHGTYRVVSKLQKEHGFEEADAFMYAYENHKLGGREQLKTAIEFAMEDENVRDMDDFYRVLEEEHGVTHKKGKSDNQYFVEYENSKGSMSVYKGRGARLGTNYKRDQLEERLAQKDFEPTYKPNKEEVKDGDERPVSEEREQPEYTEQEANLINNYYDIQRRRREEDEDEPRFEKQAVAYHDKPRKDDDRNKRDYGQSTRPASRPSRTNRKTDSKDFELE